MKTAAIAATIAFALSGAALAQTPTAPQPASTLASLPVNSVTVTNYYKQNVYDSSDTKIGEVADVLVDAEGRVTALIVSVGGFLGVGEKDVAVPFTAVRNVPKDGKWRLVMNTSKDALKAAPGYTYDRTKTQWVPEGSKG